MDLRDFTSTMPCQRPACYSTICGELVFEAWERMTYGGCIARYDDIVPFNIYIEIAGRRVSYPYATR